MIQTILNLNVDKTKKNEEKLKKNQPHKINCMVTVLNIMIYSTVVSKNKLQ